MQANISLIAAVDSCGGIGKDNALPWHNSEDLKYFRRITSGNVIIMGRKTFESIGRPLPNRINVVITRYTIPGIETYANIDDAVARHKDKRIYFIGGASIYEEAFKYRPLDAIITSIDGDYQCDTFFPMDNLKLASSITGSGMRLVFHFN